MIKSDDAGKLVIRVALGVLILLHGLFKIKSGVGGIAGMLSSHGLPGFLAYFVLVGEVVAPVLMIIGLFTRIAGWVIAVNMVVAIGLAHMGSIASFTGQGGWALELQGMFLFASIAVALFGAGRFSVGGTSGRYN
ncbi:DoxX family protein [Alcaligenaceae bacterium A4P071]|nr:DoxX family protein [Alcaligenaceae bacterium B3P038]MDQ2149733.1 DoxX family protein [Alcaligenaceae bacterium C4P045]MDQ2184065.1 DoxX family protein [Alcaligenaceae bacterium A4P071]